MTHVPSPDETMAAPERASILVVDDRPEQLLALQAVLEDLGQNIVTAASGEMALKRVLEHDFAVILLDVHLPGIDGLETAEMIRGRKKSAHVPIIFITADHHDEMHRARGYLLGAVDYITSPVVPDALRSKVKVFVDLYLYAQRERQRIEAQLELVAERAARAAAERAERRAGFLVQATTALARSLDLDATMRHLAALVVPRLGDVAVVRLAEGDDDPKTMLACNVAEAGAPPSVSMIGAVDDRWLAQTIEAVAADERSVAINCATASTLGNFVTLERAVPIAVAPDCAVHSLVLVPLAARGRSLGVLTLGLTEPSREFDIDMLSTTIDLATRASIALDNAVLFRRIHEEDRRKNEFLAMLAHELRNPLTPIGNALHVLEADGQAAGRSIWAREMIRRQFDLLVRLVDDLLDVSRITRGKIDLRIEPVDVVDVVDVAVETSRPQIDAMHHTLDVSLPEGPLHLRGDFARVAQIIGNLLSNAAKYTEPGGRIWLNVEREGEDVVLRVRDTGMGIPKHALLAIFDLFTQLNRTIDRAKGGLGIGLTVVRRLVEMQGGSVVALSDGPDRGSEFVVRLPVAEPVVAVTSASAGEATTMQQPLSVLVVDDNRDVAESTATLLQIAGHEVHVAYDGLGAIETAARVRPQLALIDIGLPGIDGYEVARRLRRDPRHSGTWICALSGYDTQHDRERSRNAGFDHHFVKPLDPARLEQALASLTARGPQPSTEPATVQHG